MVFHNSSSWIKIRLHTENQLPGLPGSALKVCVGGVVVVGSTQLCGHPNFVLGWSRVVTISASMICLQISRAAHAFCLDQKYIDKIFCQSKTVQIYTGRL